MSFMVAHSPNIYGYLNLSTISLINLVRLFKIPILLVIIILISKYWDLDMDRETVFTCLYPLQVQTYWDL